MSCDYCQLAFQSKLNASYPKSDLITYSKVEGEPTIEAYIVGNELHVYSERQHEPYSVEKKVKINFCPMCGDPVQPINREVRHESS